VILVLLLGVMIVMTPGGRQVATEVYGRLTGWIDRWSGGGAVASGELPEAGGVLDTSAPSRARSLFRGLWDGFRALIGDLFGWGSHLSPVDTSQSGESGFGRLLSNPKFTSYPTDAVTEGSVVLKGTGNPGDLLSIYRDGQLVGEVTVKDNGTWNLSIASSRLSIGENSFSIGRDGGTAITITYAPFKLAVPVRLQDKLGTDYACSPTSMGMVFDYYHAQDASRPTQDTQTIIDHMKGKGWFTEGKGIPADDAAEVARQLGYENSYFFTNWTLDNLRQEINAGHPVITTIREGVGTSGYAHSVVVTGISPDGQTVFINDPMQGSREISWEQFSKSWGSFDVPNHGYVVVP
jgi:predicted double-glycine peptidase